MGYTIPAGAVIIPNQWWYDRIFTTVEYNYCRAVLHDEATYPEPFRFWPERWLNDRGELLGEEKAPLNPSKVAFGFGRRCVIEILVLILSHCSMRVGFVPELILLKLLCVKRFVTICNLKCHHIPRPLSKLQLWWQSSLLKINGTLKESFWNQESNIGRGCYGKECSHWHLHVKSILMRLNHNSHPEPFQCHITVRSGAAQNLILRLVEDVSS